jgi:hypothetical protein
MQRKSFVPIEIIVDLSLVEAKAPLRALADVTLSVADVEITIRRCAVFEKSGEPPWATLPRLLVEKNGKKQFVPLIELPRDLRARVLNSVLAKYGEKADAR